MPKDLPRNFRQPQHNRSVSGERRHAAAAGLSRKLAIHPEECAVFPGPILFNNRLDFCWARETEWVCALNGLCAVSWTYIGDFREDFCFKWHLPIILRVLIQLQVPEKKGES